MKLQPGKRVQILEHQMNILDDLTHILVVYVTKDSIGIIISFEQYCANEVDLQKRGISVDPNHLIWVKSEMEEGTHYPIQLAKFAPLQSDEYKYLEGKFSTVKVL